MQGFGVVSVERDEPVFHESWQATAFALMVATQVVMRSHNADEYRHSIERMSPAQFTGALLRACADWYGDAVGGKGHS